MLASANIILLTVIKAFALSSKAGRLALSFKLRSTARKTPHLRHSRARFSLQSVYPPCNNWVLSKQPWGSITMKETGHPTQLCYGSWCCRRARCFTTLASNTESNLNLLYGYPTSSGKNNVLLSYIYSLNIIYSRSRDTFWEKESWAGFQTILCIANDINILLHSSKAHKFKFLSLNLCI